MFGRFFVRYSSLVALSLAPAGTEGFALPKGGPPRPAAASGHRRRSVHRGATLPDTDSSQGNEWSHWGGSGDGGDGEGIGEASASAAAAAAGAAVTGAPKQSEWASWEVPVVDDASSPSSSLTTLDAAYDLVHGRHGDNLALADAALGVKDSHELVEVVRSTGGPPQARMRRGHTDFVFVDEHKCVGCTLCAGVAPSTFFMEPYQGQARAYQQHGDAPSAVEEAIATCPVNCIHHVTYPELEALEVRRRCAVVNKAARPSGEAPRDDRPLGTGAPGTGSFQPIQANRDAGVPAELVARCVLLESPTDPARWDKAMEAAKQEQRKQAQQREQRARAKTAAARALGGGGGGGAPGPSGTAGKPPRRRVDL